MENVLSNNDDYFFQKRIEVMIDTNNKKISSLSNELNNIKAIISKLNEEICELKKKINNSELKTESFESVKTESFVDNNHNQKIRNNETTKPRYGDYKPEDVAVDKFFYFGNKKKVR